LFRTVNLLDHQGAGIDAATLCRPGLARVINRITGLRQGQAQGPAQGALAQALLQVVLQVVTVVDLALQGGERRLW
jgi:hypothetical protein